MPENRLHQYKNGFRKSSMFKDVLMKKCIAEMKISRMNIHNSRRNLDKFEEEEAAAAIKAVINNEMDNFTTDDKILMFEALRNDLLQLEYDDFENLLQEEDASLLAHLEEDVFCPNCTINPMDVDHTGMLCRGCNFAHPAQILVTRTELAEKFRTAFSAHAELECKGIPKPIAERQKLGVICHTCTYISEIL